MMNYAPEVAQAGHRLMQEILPLKDQRFVDSAKIRMVVDRCQVKDIEARIYFLRELHTLVRKLPLKIYNDEQSRLRLLTAIQDALDEAIDEEEDELD